MRQRILLAGPSMRRLAEKIVAARPDEIRLGELQWKTFPNGQPNVKILEDPDDIRASSVSFLMGFKNPLDYQPQMRVLNALRRLGPGRLQLLVPFHSEATSERRDDEGDVPCAVGFADDLANNCGAACRVFFYDIHALPVQEMFPKTMTIIPRTGTTLLKDWTRTKQMQDRAVIGFADTGAFKSFFRRFNGSAKDGMKFTMATCDKRRVGIDGEERLIVLRPGEETFVQGKFVILVDDILRSGKTMIRAAEAMYAAGASKVAAYCTHADFEPGSVERVLATKDLFEFVMITDSCPEAAYAVDGVGPFRVVSLATKLATDVCEDLTITERAALSNNPDMILHTGALIERTESVDEGPLLSGS